MAEKFVVTTGSKDAQYRALIPQIEALISGETDFIANLSNVAAALKTQFGHLWVGFYLVKNEQLVLGPFQGPVACTRIAYGKGVCGTAWQTGEPQIVADVEAFPGHIACSSLSKSEIVLPIFSGDEVIGVLDIDSEKFGAFSETDARYLQRIIRTIPIPMNKDI